MATQLITKGKRFMLAGDVGGTKTRMGIFMPTRHYPEFHEVRTYFSGDYPDLESVVKEYLKELQVSVKAACFGIAGPVENGRCHATNIPWEVSECSLRNGFSLQHVRLINDLAAVGSSTSVLKNEELLVLQKGRPDKNAPRGVVAPGTGLGMSLVVKVKDEVISIPSEGGHADFAPNQEDEVELWRYIRNSIGHVSVERVVSGQGLINIYRWLTSKSPEKQPSWLIHKMEQEDPAQVISGAALGGDDPVCHRALEIFVSVLGAVSGNLALTGLTFGGLYLGGGIVPQIIPFLKEGLFLQSFLDKGRFSNLLKNIPVYVILNDQAALLGAAVYLCSDGF